MTCGARLKALMDDRDIKQKTLAAEIGLNQNTLSNYVTGRSAIPNDVLVKLASSLSVTTDYLLGKTDIPDEPFPVSSAERAMLSDFRTLNRNQKELIVCSLKKMIEQNTRS